MKKPSARQVIVGIATVTAISGAIAMKGEVGGIAWTSLPVAIALLPLGFVSTFKREARYATYAFSTTTTVILAFFYVGWTLDVGSMASGSSTSALMFVFLPLYALMIGCVSAMIAAVAGLVHEYLLGRGRNKAL